MITYKKHKYSVPIKYIGEYLTVSENEDTLNIYYTTDLIASHKISRKIFKLQKRACSWDIEIWCTKNKIWWKNRWIYRRKSKKNGYIFKLGDEI